MSSTCKRHFDWPKVQNLLFASKKIKNCLPQESLLLCKDLDTTTGQILNCSCCSENRSRRLWHLASSHHGGWTWMTSPGAGESRAAVSLLNSAVTRVLSSPWGCLCLQHTIFMLHTSKTCSTSSTSMPGLSTGEQSNDNTAVKSVCECVGLTLIYAITVLCKVCFSLWD